ncbi:RNA methyltransferase, RsmE family [Leptospira inadai serovar Lyme str. 10]|uniref:Ribosomal RNA small subunit methyltransferase E n=2 Tax=Leptospira inadai serovar Lyme TaxID=293084 RepID=V6HA40_9LEPT|nr:RsmE family RNA methyltransferase [Leptospira inadai]EQA36191.1 RNA methyltransferase, RsmE family [Leptospira inadai serovar Lyme str. 10]PNV74917.1 16S rRNA methyltransferase [Leptospira inadai serovar Lyme]
MSDSESVFFRPNFRPDSNLRLDPEEISHLKALRIFNDKKIVIVKDGKGASYLFEVPPSAKTGTILETEFKENTSPPAVIATAIPKGNRLEWLIQKGTELGITEFIFLTFAHSDRKDLNAERLLRVAGEACAQAKREFLPEILGPMSLLRYLESLKNPSEEVLLLDPEGLGKLDTNSIRSRTVLIGPEGGFREEEKELFRKYGVPGYKAGNSILRIETACLYAASLFRASL